MVVLSRAMGMALLTPSSRAAPRGEWPLTPSCHWFIFGRRGCAFRRPGQQAAGRPTGMIALVILALLAGEGRRTLLGPGC